MKSSPYHIQDPISCPACGGEQWDFFFAGADLTGAVPGAFNYVHCPRCSMIRMDPLPDEAQLASWYPSDYPCHRKSGNPLARYVQNWLRRKDARRITRSAGRTGTVLEIGCGIGQFLSILREFGWNVVGLEPNPGAIQVGQEVFGVDIRQGTLRPGLFEPAQFDCVVLQHVLEHVPDPTSLLQEIGRLLRPEGLLFLAIPNYDSWDRRVFMRYWYGYDVPRHVFIYSQSNATAFLAGHGFQVLAIRHSPVPNNYAGSVKFFCQRQRALRWAAGFFHPTNPLTWPIFLPFSVLGALIRQSGRIEVLARRTGGDVSP